MAEHDAIRRVIDNYSTTSHVMWGDVDVARAQLDALLAREAKLKAALRRAVDAYHHDYLPGPDDYEEWDMLLADGAKGRQPEGEA